MLKQDKACGWCRKTDELVLMGQGGVVHTVCPECGSTGPCLPTNEVGKAYRALRARVSALEEAIGPMVRWWKAVRARGAYEPEGGEPLTPNSLYLEAIGTEETGSQYVSVEQLDKMAALVGEEK